MANGTPKSASVYYNDNTKYTGNAGSKTNPYCIEDLYDFNFFRNSSVGDYLIMVKDIDLNDYDAGYLISGTNSNNLLSFENLDGQNHEIRNISFVVSETGSINTFMKFYNLDRIITIKNINFLNINYYNGNGSLFEVQYTNSNYLININNCNFTVYNYKRNDGNINHKTYLIDYNSDSYYMYVFNYCTFNIKCSLNINRMKYDGVGIIHSAKYYYCHINFEVMHGFNIILNGINKFIFSYITIKCHYLYQDFKQNVKNSSSDTNSKTIVGLIQDDMSNQCSTFTGSYIYIKLIDTVDTDYDPVITYNYSSYESNYLTNYYSKNPLSLRINGPSFIVIDQEGEKNQVSLYPEPVADTSVPEVKRWNNTLMYVLTKEQAKDPDLLAKIDFPCLPYTE